MNKKFLVIACLVLVLSISLILPFASVSADYVEDIVNNPQAIVTFNQILKFTSATSYVSRVDDNVGLTFSSGFNSQFPATLSFNALSNHRYYLFNDNNNGDFRLYMSGGITQEFNTIFEPTSDISITQLFVVNTSSVDLNVSYHFNIIDLTIMYGANSDNLTLEQCKQVFTTDYYPYNPGTPMTYNTIDAYNNGVNAYLGSQEYTISSLGFINSVYPVVLNETYGCEESLVTLNTSQGYVQVDSGSSYTDPTLCLPFNYTIPAGTQITIKGKCSTTQYNASYQMHIGFWGNGGEMIVVPQGMIAGTQGFFRSSTITFTLPMSVDRIYLIVTDDATWQLKDFEVGYYLTNADVLRELGYQDGVAYMQKLYAPTGAYYQAIYQQGYNDGHDAPTYTFKDLIVASVDTPIQAFTSLFDFDILGVNMKTFYLSIFTMCVIFVVLKLVL